MVKHCLAEQESIGCEINLPASPFPRFSYSDVVDELKKGGEDLEFGDDFFSFLIATHLKLI